MAGTLACAERPQDDGCCQEALFLLSAGRGMSSITVAEALAEFERIDRRLRKKEQFIEAYLLRDAGLRDPLAAEGGSSAMLAREMESMKALQERKVLLRRLIQRANEQASVTLDGQTRSVADWLVWKREVATQRSHFLGDVRTRINRARKGGLAVVVHLDEKALMGEIEALEQCQGQLAGQVTLKNATTSIRPPEDAWMTGVEDRLDEFIQRARSLPEAGLGAPWATSPELCELARDPTKKIAAIKLYRELTGSGLAESKTAVEVFMASQR
jgi:hypothetical protein